MSRNSWSPSTVALPPPPAVLATSTIIRSGKAPALKVSTTLAVGGAPGVIAVTFADVIRAGRSHRAATQPSITSPPHQSNTRFIEPQMKNEE
jgi:hypothetical protein